MIEIDDEVMEALEQERYAKFVFKGKVYRIENIIDLINRKNAEIERLKKQDEFAEKIIREQGDKILNLQSENGRLTDRNLALSTKIESLICQCISAREKTIKEFAERLKGCYIKNKIYDRPNAHTLVGFLFYQIDTLVAEMVGDTK